MEGTSLWSLTWIQSLMRSCAAVSRFGKMKSVLLQIFPVMLLLLLGLGLGLGLGLWLASRKLEDNQELLNQLWGSDSWEEAETIEDIGGIKGTELQQSGNNDMLILDEAKASMAEASEKEAVGHKTPVTEESFQKEAVFYSRQLRNNRDCSIMMAQKLGPKGTCKEKHTFIHEHYDKVRDICATPNIPCKKKGSNCHQSREPLQLTVCQLIHETVSNQKCKYQSIPMTMNIIIACDGMNPQTFKEHT